MTAIGLKKMEKVQAPSGRIARIAALKLLIFCLLWALPSQAGSPMTLRNSTAVGLISGMGLGFTHNGRNLFHEGTNASIGITFRKKHHGFSFEVEWTLNNYYKHLGHQVGFEQRSWMAGYQYYLLQHDSKGGFSMRPFVGALLSLEMQGGSLGREGAEYYASKYHDGRVSKVFPGFGTQFGINIMPKQDGKVNRLGKNPHNIKRKLNNKFSIDLFTEFVFIPNGQTLSTELWDNFRPGVTEHAYDGFVFADMRWVSGFRIRFERQGKVDEKLIFYRF